MAESTAWLRTFLVVKKYAKRQCWVTFNAIND